MHQNPVPEFMMDYYEDSNWEGKVKIEDLARQYSDESATFLQTVFVQKQEFLRDWNRRTGQRKELSAEEALAPLREQYTERAKALMPDERHQYLESPPKQSANPTTETSRAAFLSNIKSMHEQSQHMRPRH